MKTKNFLDKYAILFGIAWLVIGAIQPAICCLSLGSFVLYKMITGILFLNKVQKRGIKCIGRILSYQSGFKGSKTPVVEFKSVQGELITGQPTAYASTDLSIIRSYKKYIDRPVSVLYDKDDPQKFILTGETEFAYAAYIFAILVALAFIIIGFSVFLGYIKLSR
jgi:hypothetical protein